MEDLMEPQIIFRCMTCLRKNVADFAKPDFVRVLTVFDSLNEALVHIGDNPLHEVVVIQKSEL